MKLICKVCDNVLTYNDRNDDYQCLNMFQNEQFPHFIARFSRNDLIDDLIDEIIVVGIYELYKSACAKFALIQKFEKNQPSLVSQIQMDYLTSKLAKRYYQKLLTYNILA